MLVKIEALILIFPGTNFHFSSTSEPPGTFLRLCIQHYMHQRTLYMVGLLLINTQYGRSHVDM